jgi:hypothetical protein
MMILSAVILILAFIALAGMVARVQQLAGRTTSESDLVILSDVAPLSASIDSAICRLKDSTLATRGPIASVTVTGAAMTTITQPATNADFSSQDIGMGVTGSGITLGTRIVAVSGDTATISQPGTTTPTTLTFVSCLPFGDSTETADLDLSATSSPTLEQAIGEMMETLAAIETQHGFWLDWSMCYEAGFPARGHVVVSLTDGSVWFEFRSTVVFPTVASTTCP